MSDWACFLRSEKSERHVFFQKQDVYPCVNIRKYITSQVSIVRMVQHCHIVKRSEKLQHLKSKARHKIQRSVKIGPVVAE